ncbi:UxaA family hydrolase [Labrys okinawensis]|uniref:UxaA family hydrolase n=1 Tax=Labrys okinawensis TaxID=346911 RepID=UPI0039BC9253
MAEAAANMVILAPNDNVGIALRDIAAGSLARTIAGRALEAGEAIPQGHKIALADIARGALILRFGVPVAVTRADIPMGRLVHVHNVASRYLNNDEDHYE